MCRSEWVNYRVTSHSGLGRNDTPGLSTPNGTARTLRDEADTGSPSWLMLRASAIKRGKAMQDRTDPDALLTPSEVAEMFRVNPKTVTRWARAGKISAIRTLGGHRRFRAIEIMRYLEQVESDQGL